MNGVEEQVEQHTLKQAHRLIFNDLLVQGLSLYKARCFNATGRQNHRLTPIYATLNDAVARAASVPSTNSPPFQQSPCA